MNGSGDRRRQERVRADWSARFEGDAIVVDGHVVDLSIVSARIRSLSGEPVPVKPGDAGTLTLAFPETAAPRGDPPRRHRRALRRSTGWR